MFFNIGTPELLVILVIALIVVGPRRLPEIGRSVGRVLSQLRKVQDEVRDTLKFDLSDDWPGMPETKPIPTPHQDRGFDAPDLNGPDLNGPDSGGRDAAAPAADDNTPEAEE